MVIVAGGQQRKSGVRTKNIELKRCLFSSPRSVTVFVICTTWAFGFPHKKAGRVFLTSCILACVCSLVRSIFCSEDVYFSSLLPLKEQPVHSLMLPFDYKGFAPLRVDTEAAPFSVWLASDWTTALYLVALDFSWFLSCQAMLRCPMNT